ncbi:MAG: carbohydrate porin [Candidatus Omnitrophica bacterium]|nr:carbohydrate porin [Candidatus Omnitrophota bacterium]
MRRTAIMVVLGVFAMGASPAAAEEESLRGIVAGLTARVEALEKKVVDQQAYIQEHERCIHDQRKVIAEQDTKIKNYEASVRALDERLHRQEPSAISIGRGLEIGAGATVIVQGTNNANADGTGEDRADASYSADITLAKDFESINGRAFVHLEAGTGDGLEDNLALYSNVNRDADNNNDVHLTEVWYEQGACNDRLALTFGKLDPTVYFDTNEAANDETTQFLGRIFRNNPTVEFPDNTLGIRFAYEPKEWVEFNVGFFDAGADWNKVGDNAFCAGQATFKHQFFGHPGNYRILGWYNDLPHTSWLTSTNDKEPAFGFALSFDQKVTEEVMLFCRYGWQDPRVYNPSLTATGGRVFSLEQSWSAGVQVEGGLWGRAKDVLGFAVGQAIASGDYKKSNSALAAKSEGHLEAYYNVHLNDYLSISPDFQYIWNPFGKDVVGNTDPVCVWGLRSQIDF